MQRSSIRVIRNTEELADLPRGNIFVPTMGALHAGHGALIVDAARRARDAGRGRSVVVSIFVNPTQFNDASDYSRYPKTLEADLKLAQEAGATHAFVPDVEMIYPRGMEAAKREAAEIRLPPVATEPKLEDARRPGHFAGVYQVVWRLFELVRPAQAIFGEKDWQQLQLIAAMTAEMNQKVGAAIEIVPSPTIREPDGLAMSSRNRFLTAEERKVAPVIFRAMGEARQFGSPDDAEKHLAATIGRAGLEPEYAVVRDAATLTDVRQGHPWRILVAARLGSVRLIDNMGW